MFVLAKATARLYRHETGMWQPPCCQTTASRLIKRFETTGSVADQPRSGPTETCEITMTTVEESLEDHQELHPLGVCSSADVSHHSQAPQSTVKRILRKNLSLRPYHIRRVQELED